MRRCCPHHVRLGPRADGFYNDAERDAFIERQTEAVSKALSNVKRMEAPMTKKEATPKGWHITINESKRGRFRPVIKYVEKVRAIMPVGTSFDTAAMARREGERILGAGVEDARSAGERAGHDKAEAVFSEILDTLKQEKTARVEGEKSSRKEGMARGWLLGVATAAIIFVAARWFFGNELGLNLL